MCVNQAYHCEPVLELSPHVLCHALHQDRAEVPVHHEISTSAAQASAQANKKPTINSESCNRTLAQIALP